MTRFEMRLAAQRLPYSSLAWLSQHEECPAMQRAAAKREMRRRDKQDAAWFTDFMARQAKA